MKVFYIVLVNMAFLLHEVAPLLAILGIIYCKGWIYGDITNVCEPVHKVKYEGLRIHGLKYGRNPLIRTLVIRIVLAVRVNIFLL